MNMKIHCDSDVLGKKILYLKNKRMENLSFAANKQQKIDTTLGSGVRLLENCYWYNKFQTSV